MIGVFDSGVGGLTIVKEIFKYLPEYQIIYFGDTARLPYGTKGADFVQRYSAKIVNWLLKKKAKLIVVACHTSSAWASDFLKEKFSAPKGRDLAEGENKMPIFEMITPGASEAANSTKSRKVGIIGTSGTIKSGSWEKKLLELNPGLKIYSKPCPLFVSLVEEGWINKGVTKKIAEEYLEPFKEKKIDTLVLACTHYPLLKKIIGEVVGTNIKIINPAESLAKELKLFLKDNLQIASQIKKGKNHQFFFSDQPYNLEKISHLCFDRQIKPIIKDPF